MAAHAIRAECEVSVSGVRSNEPDCNPMVAHPTSPSVSCDMSMDVRSGGERLERMIDAIVGEVRPRRVILFGSRARGEARPASDYDFVIELPFEDDTVRRAVDTRVRNALAVTAPDAEVDLVFRRPGQVEARCNDPGYMDWDIARDGVVVYADDVEQRALIPVVAGRDRIAEPRRNRGYASIAEWLVRADEDRRALEQLLRGDSDVPWSAVCFHAQQLAEKYLKVLFVHLARRPPRTHDLSALVNALRPLGVGLPDLSEACSALKGYAVDVRYPENATIPTPAEGRAAAAAARHIVEECNRVARARGWRARPP
jgi:HEPN domain-containing protein/predicted nucleotidyltransferase